MESIRPPASEAIPVAVSFGRKLSHRHHQQKTDTMREEFQRLCYTKMERVKEWVDDCAAAQQVEAAGAFLEYDGETEELLLQVLIARPKYQGIPTVQEIQQFAGQLRAYNSRLWTLGMTKGFFRPSSAPGELGWLPEYPDDIDSVESMSMHEEEEGANWMVHGQRVFVRKISPLEEELQNEMTQEYRNIRRHSVKDNATTKHCRTRSMDGFARRQMAGSTEYQARNVAC